MTTPMTLDEMRARDAEWEPPPCNCDIPTEETFHRPAESYCVHRDRHHEQRYDPAQDTSPEADRRRLLAMYDDLWNGTAGMLPRRHP